jgi:branched-chain amino acid transport system ATP-binding protein
MTTPSLATNRLCAGYGAADVIKDVTISLADGECVAVLGANGAGKTSLLRAISGLLAPNAGSVHFFGEVPQRHDASAIAAMRVAHVPEGRGTIGGLTVEENLRAGAYLCSDGTAVRAEIERCFGYFPILRTYRSRIATSLSGGEQQMLALSRALMMRPRVMLLDEPSFGLAPKIVRSVYQKIAEIIAQSRLSVLLVEQSIELAERIATRAYLLKNGRIVAEGRIEELKKSAALREAYFSRSGSAH